MSPLLGNLAAAAVAAAVFIAVQVTTTPLLGAGNAWLLGLVVAGAIDLARHAASLRVAISAILVLVLGGGVIATLTPGLVLACTLLALLHGLLHHWARRYASDGRAVVISAVTIAGGLLAAGHIGWWQALGGALMVWTWLLSWALADLLQQPRRRAADGAFARRARALERLLEGG